MTIEQYLNHYKAFHDEFFPYVGIKDKRNKLFDETVEFQNAVMQVERSMATKEATIDEAVDVMNTAIAYLVSEGIENPLIEGIKKLERTAEKYRCRNGL